MSVKVSVVIPVYNVEKYLIKCLDSVVGQTLRDIEVICVDDGSTDGSAKILAEVAARDKRVTVIEQPNSGAGKARNKGLAVATGEYVYFIDPDDYLAEDTALEKLYCAATSLNADILVFGFDRIDGKTGKYIMTQKFGHFVQGLPDVFSANDCADRLFTAFMPAPWNKFFRREHIARHRVEFQSLPRANDLCFSFTALAAADRISVLDESLHCYRVNRQGSVQSNMDADPFPVCKAYLQVMTNLKRNGTYPVFMANLTRSFFSSVFYTLYMLSDYNAANAFFKEIRFGKYGKLTACKLCEANFAGNSGDYQRYLSFMAASDVGAFFQKEAALWRANAQKALNVKPMHDTQGDFRKQYENLRSSISCRVGFALTWPLRFIFNLLTRRH